MTSKQETQLTRDKFDQGMTTQQYIDQIKVNKDPFVAIYETLQVPAESLSLFNGLSEPLKLAVFTADWCGDAMSTTPVILKLADSTPNLSVQVFNRDDELELSNSLLPEHRAGTVPIFVVMDQDMNQVVRFIETANSLVPDIDAMDAAIDQETAGMDEAEQRQAKRGRRTSFRVERAQAWGEVILKEFGGLVAEALAGSPQDRPLEGGTKWPPEG
ncbi:MAG: thioredoxin family protein [Chloroflexi bacterium]|nr:thioredoxin family protein [Chloroflexota bacterium]MCI0802042.1 thioredoxin family protein [Chloroflexota bacterium]MCI0829818.1 thioredoxin family protein [Chloroflexota bacterium]MCI0847401.1 thioredoxin family protein [Chloroflexota bacterium]MCI0864138.1 thioredoxin family protein [Chloroflexota bacterium]